MNRRGFLSSVIALSVAPAIVRAQSLMPGRGLIVPTTLGQDSLIWINNEIDRLGVNRLWSPALVTREALRILETTLVFDSKTGECIRSTDRIRIQCPTRFT